MATPAVLIVPGWGDSGPEHWQTLWERAHPDFRRVTQKDWFWAVRDEWVDALESAIREARAPAVLVAHSLGCHAVAQVARRPGLGIRAALLVAPPDVERPDFPPVIEGFTPGAWDRLPFSSVVVASSDDPYTTMDRARGFAQRWGSRFVEAGPCGHINADAGFGPWPAGERLLEELLHG